MELRPPSCEEDRSPYCKTRAIISTLEIRGKLRTPSPSHTEFL